MLTTYQDGILLNTETQTYTGPELLASDSDTTSGATTTNTYNTYTGPNSIPLYRLASVVSTLGSTTFQQTTYGYDETTPTGPTNLPQHVSVSTQRGNLTSIHQTFNSSSSPLITTNAYDDTGTMLTSTSPNGMTSYGHDSTGTLVTNITPPTPSSGVPLPVSAVYDPNTGLVISAKDANGTQTKYTYNGMLQPTEIDNLDSGNNTVGKSTTSYYNPTAYGMFPYQSASVSEDYQYLLDAYGRTSRSIVNNGQATNPWYQQDTCYDTTGHVSFQSYRYQGNAWSTPKVCAGSGDSYAYDALGRVTSITHADGTSIQYTYRGRATEVTDENGVSRITQVDGLGRTTAVCEVSANSSMPGSGSLASCGMDIADSGFLTNYAYDLANHKITITQGAQQRVFQTDWLGRTIFTQEPERRTTNYTYAYNSTGLVVTRQRPEANQTNASVLTTTTTQYDAVGRVVSVNYDDGITPNKMFAYDTNTYWTQTAAANLKGRLAVMGALTSTSDHTGALFSYDAMGRVVNLWQCAPSICATAQASRPLAFTYDWTGNLTSEVDPASGNISYFRSVANEVTSITNNTYSGTYDPSNLVSTVVNGPNGAVSYQLGNGLSTFFSYDTLGRRSGGWVCTGQPERNCAAGTQMYGYVVGWKGTRNTGICDTVLGNCETFGYDEFDRLTSQSVTQGTGQNYSFVYDRYGNRWQENTTNGGQNSFNANNQIIGYNYDAAGNQLADVMHSYTYDAEGNILKVDNGSTAVYVYDALNRRVSSQTTSGVTEYTFDYAGRRISSWLASNNFGIEGRIYWDGMPIAFHAANNYTYFQHQDWMGTERMRTDYAGAVADTDVSLPFGDGFSESFSEAYANQDNNHFAGLEWDTESGTDHAQFRQYSELQGNWMSPDPYDGSYDFSNPQSFNRYSYVLNNPLSMTDPLGLNPPVGSGGGYNCANNPVCIANSGSSGGGVWSDPWGGPCCGVLGGLEMQLISSGEIPWLNVQGGELMMLISDPMYAVTGTSVFTFAQEPLWGDLGPTDAPSGAYSIFGFAQGGGGGGGAPSKTTCTTQALVSGAGSIALDSIGLIPEAEGFLKVFENTAGYQLARAAGNAAGYRGVVATQYGMKAVAQGKGGAALIAGAFGLGDTSVQGRLSTGLTVAGFVPGLGTLAAGASIVNDAIKTGMAVAKCP